jgi:formiminotetrahydrofolate cyclodeaminase
MTVSRFVEVLGSDAPAPGGGSVAALCGALSGALAGMVASLTHGKKGYEAHWPDMEQLGIRAQRLKDEFMREVDRDTEAFNKVMDAFRLPKKSDEEKAQRQAAVEAATKEATLVPLDVLRRCLEVVQLSQEAVLKGNKNSISDGGVSALCARTAAEGAYFNVCINLGGLQDQAFIQQTRAEAAQLREQVVKESEAAVKAVEATF